MPHRDLITWNKMISGLDRSGSHDAIHLLHEMCSQSNQHNCFTFTSIVPACPRFTLLNSGEQVHAAIIRKSFAQNPQVANALVNLYTKYGSIVESIRIFDGMSQRDLVSYTSVMTGMDSRLWERRDKTV